MSRTTVKAMPDTVGEDHVNVEDICPVAHEVAKGNYRQKVISAPLELTIH
jgi:hypothetical protein